MAHRASYWGELAASDSSDYDIQAIIHHPLVMLSRCSMDYHDLSDSVASSDHYSLMDMVDRERLSITGDESDETLANKWVREILGDLRNVYIPPPPPRRMSQIEELPAFHASNTLFPDVCVEYNDMPVLTVQVVSRSSHDSYFSTTKKALINAIEQCRIAREFGITQPAIGYVFPKSREESYVTKVEVEFKDFQFQYTLTFIALENLREEVQQVMAQDRSAYSSNRPGDFGRYLVRLTTDECNLFDGSGAHQVTSSCSIIVRNTSQTKYWKFIPRQSELFSETAGGQFRTLNQAVLFSSSLFPSKSVKMSPTLSFYEYQGLEGPKSRSDAKLCLLAIAERVRDALNELHQRGIAHMDLRLPNICYTTSGEPKRVMLIDLDRCEMSMNRPVRGPERPSDMYSKPKLGWVCEQVDWRSLGLLLCYVLDERIDGSRYHHMISDKLVSNEFLSDEFIHTLLHEGKWSEPLYEGFCEKLRTQCGNPL